MKKTQDQTQPIRILHSPDPDDRFMFWPLSQKKIPWGNFHFHFEEADTHSLNRLCVETKPEICAISAIHYGQVAKDYQPLRMGCSVGNGYGPVLVSKRPREPDSSSSSTQRLLLSPGPSTTAHAVLLALGWEFHDFVTVPIVPMERVFEELDRLSHKHPDWEVVALLIHEGRLLYPRFQCYLWQDLGLAWKEATGHSIPLGMNVISRNLSWDQRIALSELLRQSCAYALEHQKEFEDLCLDPESPYQVHLSREMLKEYLSLYANHSTLDVDLESQQGFAYLLNLSSQQGLFPSPNPIELDWI
jgi:1,4-dihydroxy-6-naphthoate synthase